jgi:acetyltransferase
MTLSSVLSMAKFSKESIDELTRHLPLTANLKNPVDVIGDAPADRYEKALAAVINDEGVDGALVLLTPQSMTNALGTAEAIVRIARRSNKPIISCFMGIIDVSAGVNYLQEPGNPGSRVPENAATACGALYRYANWLNRRYSQVEEFSFRHDRAGASSVLRNYLRAGKTYLGELEGQELLACYGFNVPPAIPAADDREAAEAADRIGYPVVMKIVSPQILHKSDAGGVRVGLRDAAAVREAFRIITENARRFNPAAEIAGVLVQKMAPAGHEVILGMNRYPIFGPLLMFGMGGIFVEVYQDVTFRLAPIGRLDAREMIRQIRGYQMLDGFRGQPKADQDILEQCIVRMSDLVSDHPEIAEMDINPLIVHPAGQGATVADCRIILAGRP